MEIIGVVDDVKYSGLHDEAQPVYYELSAQVPSRPMWLLVRTRGEAGEQIATVRREIRALDPDVPIDRVETMADAIAKSVSVPRFRSFLMSVLAVTALLLSAIGIYGVVAYSVSRRTQEIGLRIALGATRSRVVRTIVNQGSALAAIGVGLGIAGAAGLTRFLEKMLFGVTSLDPVTFVAAPLILTAVAVMASLIPALRASRIDPVTALRQE
jgi:ABC-type antimicrobial peptide transport system permease subunit